MASPTELLRLDGKVALVTGANGGIGPSIARRLADAGAAVALGVNRGASRAQATAADIAAAATAHLPVDKALRVDIVPEGTK